MPSAVIEPVARFQNIAGLLSDGIRQNRMGTRQVFLVRLNGRNESLPLLYPSAGPAEAYAQALPAQTHCPELRLAVFVFG
jgi:hypothetical protein